MSIVNIVEQTNGEHVKVIFVNEKNKINVEILKSSLPDDTLSYLQSVNFTVNLDVAKIDPTLCISSEIITMLALVFMHNHIVAMQHVKSLRHVYILLNLLRQLRIDENTVAEVFCKFNENNDWMHMDDHAYAYLITKVYDIEIINMNNYMDNHPAPYESFKQALALPVVKMNLSLRLEMSDYYCNVIVGPLVRQQKRKYNYCFTIDPYDEVIFPQLEYNCPYKKEDIWSCENIRRDNLPRIKIGDSVIVTKDVFEERFHQATYNMFINPPNSSIKTPFPWDVCAVAGGLVSLLLDPNYKNDKSSDVDIFVVGNDNETKKRSFERVLEWFRIDDRTVYSDVGSVCTVYIPPSESDKLGGPRYIQIISIALDTIYDIPIRFDLSSIQMCYNGKDVFCTFKGIRTIMSRVAEVSNTERIRFNRFIKNMYRGWDILKSSQAKDEFDNFEQMITDRNDPVILKVIRQLYSYHYPVIEGTTATSDEQFHLLDVLEKHTMGNIVTMSYDKANTNILISGNFDNDYGSLSYKNFKRDQISLDGYRRSEFVLKTRTGKLRFMTDLCIVQRINQFEDNHMVITVSSACEEFIGFLKMLDDDIMRLVSRNDPTKRIVDEKGQFKLHVSNARIMSQLFKKGTSVLRNAAGDALDISDDLAIGDVIQGMFTIEVFNSHNNRYFNLSTGRIIKHEEQERFPDTVDTDTDIIINEPAKKQEAIKYDTIKYDCN